MKTRNSFVGNSSSSSFIIAFKKNEKCKCCGRSDPDLIQLLESMRDRDCDDTKLIATGFDNVIEYIRHEIFDWHSDKEKKIVELMNKVGKFMADNQDWNFIACSISYHDEFLTTMIKEKEENKTLIKLWGHD